MNFSGHHGTNRLRLLLAGTTVLAVTVLLEPLFGSSWPAQLALVGAALCLLIPLFRWEVASGARAEREARRYLEGLCRLDDHQLGDSELSDVPVRLRPGNSWHATVALIRERLIDCGRRADEAEHARTASDVRLRRLENEFHQLQEILERLPNPVLAVDCLGELRWANEPAQALFPLCRPGDVPTRLESVLACRPLLELLNETRRRRSASQRVAELEWTDPLGQVRCFRVVCRPWSEPADGSAGPHGAVAVLTDISSERSIQKRHAEFVAAAAHEMKTPLSGIRAYAELLHDGEAEDAQTQEEFWGVIQTQAERLQRLIDNLLNLARIEAGVIKVDKQALSLNELLEQACDLVQPAAEQKNLTFVRDMSPLYLGVLADRDLMLQAAINLLSNAIKYTPAGGTITLRSRLDEHAVLFEVEDTGVGISPDDCARVFEKFYRVKKNEQMAAGTGLGLPLAKHVVEDVHGGAIALSSRLDAGSVFRVTLPAVGKARDIGDSRGNAGA